jgi:hypothetical protein
MQARLVGALVGMVMLASVGLWAGCGPEPATTSDAGTSEASATTATGAASTSTSAPEPATPSTSVSSSTSDSSPPSQSTIARLFGDLARTSAPMPVYGLTELPAGCSIPAEWWPVLSLESRAAYEGPAVLNPRVVGEEQGAQEAEVLLQFDEGWLLILENFRGDLGDVSGSTVGDMAGRPARLYEVNGGVLVQWSDQGAWYGVFGRGLAAADVVQVALALTVVEPSH